MGTYFSLLIAIPSAVIFYKIGDLEYGKGYLLCLVSVAVSALSVLALHLGVLGTLAAQVGLFIAAWAYNVMFDR